MAVKSYFVSLFVFFVIDRVPSFPDRRITETNIADVVDISLVCVVQAADGGDLQVFEAKVPLPRLGVWKYDVPCVAVHDGVVWAIAKAWRPHLTLPFGLCGVAAAHHGPEPGADGKFQCHQLTLDYAMCEATTQHCRVLSVKLRG
jgi:hypothetical protein